MRGTFKGQLRAIYHDRETRPDRVSDFREALESGDFQMPRHVIVISMSAREQLSEHEPMG
jgi:hypothetical protein